MIQDIKIKKVVVTIDITTEKCYILKCNNGGYIKKTTGQSEETQKII
nr:hypothetical protein [uncultured Blautia sp.]